MPFLDETGLKRVWSKVLDKTHPVGSLYWSSNPTNPGSLFGGTWVQIKDKFVLAAGDTYKNGTTGGSADAVVVSHTHSIPSLSGSTSTNPTVTPGHNVAALSSTNFGIGFQTYGVPLGENRYPYSSSSNDVATRHSHTVTTDASTTGSQGVSGAGKNMPPYEAYYCWKRTA